jgi:hypothetical protein
VADVASVRVKAKMLVLGVVGVESLRQTVRSPKLAVRITRRDEL